VVIEAFTVSDTVTYKSDVEKGNNLMLRRLSPVATLEAGFPRLSLVISVRSQYMIYTNESITIYLHR